MLGDDMAYFTKEVNSNIAKPPLNFSGGLATLGLTSLIKYVICDLRRHAIISLVTHITYMV